MNRTAGLVATSQAPMSPAHGVASFRPMPNVARTRMAPVIGIIQKAPSSPPTSLPTAIIMGRPGGYMGETSQGSTGLGRVPIGAKVQRAIGQGAGAAHD